MSSFLFKRESVRNLVFGIEDSLVSTVGLISGITTAGMERSTILVTGLILILVEAFSMAVGSLVSDNSAEEVVHHRQLSYRASETGAWIMFVSYVLSGALILIPYLFVPTTTALWFSIAIALVVLFILGVVFGHVAHISPWRKGLSLAAIGGVTVLIGCGIGLFFR